MKTIILSLLAAICVINVYAQPKIGSVAPEITLTDKSGQSITLSSLRGKVVLVDFWASWCMPCRKSNRSILPVYNRYKDKGFEVYGISLDDDATAWQKAISVDRITWLQFNEKGSVANSTAETWNIEFLPTSFLIDKNGKIITIDPSEKDLNKYLQLALK